MSRTRPTKLRSACNQCCAAKVKCSGERTGCERCQIAGTQCIYLESRVGKVPGVRARKRRLENDENAQPPTATYPVTQTSLPPATAALASPVPTLLEQQQPSQEQAWQWAMSASPLHSPDATAANADFLESRTGSTIDVSVSDSTESMVTASTTEDFMSSLNFDMDDIWNSPPPQRTSPTVMAPPPPPATAAAEAAQAPQQPPKSNVRVRGNENDSRCVMQCCQLVSDLESYIQADMQALQILLGIIRKANEKLNELIGLQKGSRNLRCLMLFNTIFYQILELLNSCYKTIAAPKDQLATSLLMSGGLGLGGLGGLGFDEDEQSAWQAHRILKEINQGLETVRKMKLLAGVGPDHSAGAATPQAQAREHCYVDLEHRLRDLAGKVNRKM